MKSFLEQYPSAKTEILKAAEVAGYLWQKGWAERNGGNITVNITELVDTDKLSAVPAIGPATPIGMTLPHLKGTFFFCKGTNRRMRDLARNPMDNGSVIRILPDCASYEMIADNPVKPTSELPSPPPTAPLSTPTPSTSWQCRTTRNSSFPECSPTCSGR